MGISSDKVSTYGDEDHGVRDVDALLIIAHEAPPAPHAAEGAFESPRTMFADVALSGRCASSVQAVGGSLLKPIVVGMRVDLSRANPSHHHRIKPSTARLRAGLCRRTWSGAWIALCCACTCRSKRQEPDPKSARGLRPACADRPAHEPTGSCGSVICERDLTPPQQPRSRQGMGEGESDRPFGAPSADQGTPSPDREEKRVTPRATRPGKEQKQLDFKAPIEEETTLSELVFC